MQSDYKLSIIIPHYNTPDLLEKLLSTIPNRNDIQTIVVDDGSSEEVKKRLQEIKSFYDGREILFLENDSAVHNAGVSRNIGLKNAKGEWLLFADSDDYFLDGFYEIIKKYFEIDYDIVFFSFQSIEIETGQQNVRAKEYCDYIKAYLKYPNDLTEINLRCRWLAPWSKLIKKSFVESNKIFFDSSPVSNDVMFSVKIGLRAKKIAASQEEIYCVTLRKGGLTTKFDLETFEMRTGIDIKCFHFLKENLSKEEFREVEAYYTAWGALSVIVRRKYGGEVFMKYLRIFLDNKMFIFDIRIFSHLNILRWLRRTRRENEFRQHYEEK